jgi:MMP 1-O-methyltransferase
LGSVVEIGSWKGKSTVWLAKACQTINGGPVYAIDPHVGGPSYDDLGYKGVNTETEFRENIAAAGVSSIIIPWVMPSSQALLQWQNPIGFLWIDGDHSYEGVSADFYGWSQHVREGGIIAFHDTYHEEGVRQLVDDEVLKLTGYRVLGQVDGIFAVQKANVLSMADVIRCMATRYLRKVYNHARVERKHWRAIPRKIMRGFSGPKE